jgi:hypothetical protein
MVQLEAGSMNLYQGCAGVQNHLGLCGPGICIERKKNLPQTGSPSTPIQFFDELLCISFL